MVSQHLHLNTPGKSTPCIWTQAGVGGRKSCALDYECTTCRYDQVLRRAAENNRRLQSQGKKPTGRRGRIVSWKDKLRELPPAPGLATVPQTPQKTCDACQSTSARA